MIKVVTQVFLRLDIVKYPKSQHNGIENKMR